MREILYNESAVSTKQRREETISKSIFIAAILFFIAAAYMLILVFLQLNVYIAADETSESEQLFWLILKIIVCVLLILVGVGLMFLKNKFAIFYDYEFISGELRISRTTINRRRPLYRISPEEFLRVGKVGTNAYYDLKRNRTLRETRFTKNKTPAEGKDFYYILYGDHLGKQLFIIECREELIKYISLYTARGTVEL